MGLFAFERARRLEKERMEEARKATSSSGLEEYHALKAEAKELGIEVPKKTSKDDLRQMIEDALKADNQNDDEKEGEDDE